MSSTLMSGYLEKESLYLKTMRKRWMMLNSDRNLYSFKHSKHALDDKTKATEIIDLTHCKQVRQSANKLCFALVFQDGKQRQFVAATPRESQQWMKHIRTVIDIASTSSHEHVQMQQEANTDWMIAYQQLMNMGFDEGVALIAAQKYANDIEKCIQFIAEYRNEQQAAPSEETFPSKENIDQLLDVLQRNEEEKEPQNVHQVISVHYEKRGGLAAFVREQSEYVSELSLRAEYKPHHRNGRECKLENCPFIAREYAASKQEAECSARERVLQQFVDQAHITRTHLIDIGMRMDVQREEDDEAYDEEDEEKKTKDDRKTRLSVRYQQMTRNRLQFEQIRGDTKVEEEEKDDEQQQAQPQQSSNKFVTELSVREMEDGSKYAFGVRFYYHPYYQHNTKKEIEILPGTRGMSEFGNPGYRRCDWFVSPKYVNLKQEVSNRRDGCLSVQQYENVAMKARMKHHSLGRRMKCTVNWWAVVYGVKKGESISEQHVLALLCYTDYGELCTVFRNTYRKLTEDESDEDFKQRHSEYANMARLLRETVECFGTYFADKEKTKHIDVFYHGLSMKLLFSGFQQRFYGPTSTSLREEVAVSFAEKGSGGDGIVITIKKDQFASSFFNCMAWSRFDYEAEMFFVGGFEALQVIGLRAVKGNICYNGWVRAMKVFDSGFIAGAESTEAVSEENQERLELLVQSAMKKRSEQEKEKEEKQEEQIPKYVADLFKNMLSKTKWIWIDYGLLNSEIFCVLPNGVTFYGYARVNHLYLESEEPHGIKWNVLQTLFPSLQKISIQNMQHIEKTMNGYKFVESVLLNEVWLDSILAYLSNTVAPIECIAIRYPKNEDASLQQLISKYSASFQQLSFKLSVRDDKDERYGSCKEFLIA